MKVRKLSPEDLNKMASNFGFSASNDYTKFDDLQSLMRSKQVDEFLIQQLTATGLGSDLVKEAEESKGFVSYKNFINWLYIEQCGLRIIEGLSEDFGVVEILEHYNDYYKIRVPRGDKTIGYVFGLIEDKKELYKISEYSVSQTTLEQIF